MRAITVLLALGRFPNREARVVTGGRNHNDAGINGVLNQRRNRSVGASSSDAHADDVCAVVDGPSEARNHGLGAAVRQRANLDVQNLYVGRNAADAGL